MLRQTRYMRALAPAGPLSRALRAPAAFDVHGDLRARFLRAGYAWVDVDVRGTGASEGSWRSPWFEDQRRDAFDVVEWITQQEWSTGRVGSLGISYDGTCADMLLAEPHPAVRAVAPLFSLYDVLADVAFPGGVHLSWFTEAWARYNRALDENRHHDAMVIPLWLMALAAAAKPDPSPGERALALLGRLPFAQFRRVVAPTLRRLVSGVAPVPGFAAPTVEMLAARAHNLDVHRGALTIGHRDDAGVDFDRPELTIDSFSPHLYADAQRGSGAAVYSYSGWRDGAYPHAAIKRHLTLRSARGRLTIGPWAHTGKLTIHAFERGAATRFDHGGELVSFFDETVAERPGPHGDGAPVHYFTTGEERWKACDAWPPPGVTPTPLYLGPGALTGRPGAPRIVTRAVRRDTGTGPRSRWRSLLSLVPGDYPDRRTRDRELLVFDSPRLSDALEVTGHAVVTLFVAWDRGDDAHLFAYLEDVSPEGEVYLVTEGCLRARHRRIASAPGLPASPAPPRTFLREHAAPLVAGERVELVIDLLPCSHRFDVGHRVRLALADADVDHFGGFASGAGPREMALSMGEGATSRIDLPTRAPPRFSP